MNECYLKITEGYYLNLDTRADRREHMERLLAKLNWPIRRFSAIRLDKQPSDYGLVMRQKLRGARAVASIWLSHMAVMEILSESENSGSFLILEDDVYIRKGLWEKELLPCPNLPEDWDVILFSPRYKLRQGQSHTPGVSKFVEAPFGVAEPNFLPAASKTHFCTGAHFCVIKDKIAARRIYSRMKAAPEIYDVDEFYAAENKSYGFNSPLVTAGGFGSDHI